MSFTVLKISFKNHMLYTIKKFVGHVGCHLKF